MPKRALALIFSSWGSIALKYNHETMKRRLELLGDMLFEGIKYQDVFKELDNIFVKWGAKVKLSDELKLSDSDIEALVDNALALGEVGTVVKINKAKGIEIFKLSNTKER